MTNSLSTGLKDMALKKKNSYKLKETRIDSTRTNKNDEEIAPFKEKKIHTTMMLTIAQLVMDPLQCSQFWFQRNACHGMSDPEAT